ncbi:MAG: hypothetical protein F6K14_23370 [Symploca sp. SIO2C1]|nr:hypothetical protein [Symploca sp. SIO2C1]
MAPMLHYHLTGRKVHQPSKKISFDSPKPDVGAGSPEIWQPNDNLSKPAPPALPGRV